MRENLKAFKIVQETFNYAPRVFGIEEDSSEPQIFVVKVEERCEEMQKIQKAFEYMTVFSLYFLVIITFKKS